MSTGAIIAIAVGAVLLIGLIIYAVVLSPKRREQRRLEQARTEAAERHREHASTRHTEASIAEQRAEEAKLKAQRAEHEAELARKEATLHEGRADLHEQGLADDELQTDSDGDGRFDRTATDRDRTPSSDAR
jgi:FtsZ-interacting cell division protein ZipA